MRQILLILTAMLLTCCSSESDVKAETIQAMANMGKTLIVYYSYTNKCHEIVTTLSSQIEADVVRIEPAEKGLKYEANNYGSFDNLCIYYDTNSWDFTRIGKLDNMTQEEIKTWVNAGGDNVSVTPTEYRN